ncbi:hypothetical protein BZG36_02350 [Bifiguratus adelaidae]|uniref:Protein kinase domain-containing protein n=1 Tax=Bifiguratus adelaidae TaxID=1938954 RepID=A0A261Y2F1_9FUNG|nr:hypothetical protein BZG36_02350 [Bifiguratus adelaidae]
MEHVDNTEQAVQMVYEETKSKKQMPHYPGLENYKLLQKIGDGAFSNVYRAIDLRNFEKVAIKVVRKYDSSIENEERRKHLHPDVVKKEEGRGAKRSSILKEVRIMRSINHRSIIQLIEFLESKDFYYLVLELMDGGELFHQIVKLTYFSEELSRHVIVQVANAIHYMHKEKGVAHRDIKPENLLFSKIPYVPSKEPRRNLQPQHPDDPPKVDEGEFIPGVGGGCIGRIKLADFGLSKVIWDNHTLTPCGTVGYTAPEVVKDQQYSKAVDMWALGCVLYTILCGFPPFYDSNLEALTKKVARGQYTFLSPWWDCISLGAKDLISRLLCVDPSERLSIDEFLEHPWVLGKTMPIASINPKILPPEYLAYHKAFHPYQARVSRHHRRFKRDQAPHPSQPVHQEREIGAPSAVQLQPSIRIYDNDEDTIMASPKNNYDASSAMSLSDPSNDTLLTLTNYNMTSPTIPGTEGTPKRGDVFTPGVGIMKEMFDVTYAVHRDEEERRQHKEMGAWNAMIHLDVGGVTHRDMLKRVAMNNARNDHSDGKFEGSFSPGSGTQYGTAYDADHHKDQLRLARELKEATRDETVPTAEANIPTAEPTEKKPNRASQYNQIGALPPAGITKPPSPKSKSIETIQGVLKQVYAAESDAASPPAGFTPVSDLVRNILVKVEERAQQQEAVTSTSPPSSNDNSTRLKRDLQELKSRSKLEKVDYENRIHSLNRRVQTLESEVAAAKESEAKTREELARFNTERKQYFDRIEALTSEKEQIVSTVSSYQKQLEELQSSGKDNLAVVSRKIEQIEAFEEENTSLRNKIKELRATTYALESQAQEAKDTQQASQSRLLTISKELELTKSHVTWLEGQLSTRAAEFHAYRESKADEIAHLQQTLNTLKSEASTNSVSLDTLKRKHSEQTLSYETALEDIKDLKQKVIEQEETFKAEISTQTRLVSLLETSNRVADRRVDSLEKRYEELEQEKLQQEQSFKGQLERLAAEKEQLKHDLNAAEAKMQSLKESVLSNGINGHTIHNDLASTQNETSTFDLSPSAKLATRYRKKGRTLTDVYEENVQLRQELTKKEMEVEQLSETLQSVAQEIEEKAPVLQEQREEYERVLLESEELSRSLETLAQEKDEMQQRFIVCRLDVQHYKGRSQELEQQCSDLSKQVQALLREIEPSRDVMDDEVDEGESEAQRFISQNMVTFKDIADLQTQNQKLLNLTRELTARMEQEEQQRKSSIGDDPQKAINDSFTVIERLREEISIWRTRVESLTSERDMLQGLLSESRGGGNGRTFAVSDSVDALHARTDAQHFQTLYQELQQQFDDFRHEVMANDKILQQQLEEQRSLASQYRIDGVKASSQLDLWREKHQLAKQSSEILQKDIEELRKQNNRLQDSMRNQDQANQALLNQLLEIRSDDNMHKEEASSLRSKNVYLENLQQRLLKQIEDLVNEKNQLNKLLQNIQLMRDTLEEGEREKQQELKKAKHSLEEQLQQTQARLHAEADEYKSLLLRRESETRERTIKIERLTRQLQEARESLAAIEAKQEEQQKREASLARDLEEANSQLAIYTSTSTSDASQAVIHQLRAEIADLKEQLEGAAKESRDWQSRIEEYKSISSASEEALSDLNETYSEYRRTNEAKLAASEEKVRQLSELNTQLNEQLNNTLSDISKTEELLEAERQARSKSDMVREELERELNELRANIDSEQASLREEMTRHINSAEEAHESYQKELLAHARDIEQLEHVRDQLRTLQSQLSEYQKIASSAQTEMERATQSQKQKESELSSELDSLRQTCSELRSQNDLLLSHVEAFKESVTSRFSQGENEEANENSPRQGPERVVDELREVIRWIRREKDALGLQNDVLSEENRRLKQQVDILNSSLEQTKSQLREQRGGGHKTAVSSDHADLLEKVNQINILRESNITLRSQNEQYQKKLDDLQGRLTTAETGLEPLQRDLLNYKAELEVRASEVETLKEDNMRWKSRAQQILSRYERIDPQELENLKMEVQSHKDSVEALTVERDNLLKEKEELTTQYNTLDERHKKVGKIAMHWRQKYERETADLKAKIAEYEKQINEMKETITASDSSKGESAASLKKAEEEIASLKKALEDQQHASTQNEESTAKIAELEVALQNEKARYQKLHQNAININNQRKTLMARNEALEKDKASAVEAQLQEKLKEMDELREKKVAEARSETEKLFAARLSLSSGKLAKLEARNKELEATVKQLQDRIASLEQENKSLRDQLSTLKNDSVSAADRGQDPSTFPAGVAEHGSNISEAVDEQGVIAQDGQAPMDTSEEQAQGISSDTAFENYQLGDATSNVQANVQTVSNEPHETIPPNEDLDNPPSKDSNDRSNMSQGSDISGAEVQIEGVVQQGSQERKATANTSSIDDSELTQPAEANVEDNFNIDSPAIQQDIDLGPGNEETSANSPQVNLPEALPSDGNANKTEEPAGETVETLEVDRSLTEDRNAGDKQPSANADEIETAVSSNKRSLQEAQGSVDSADSMKEIKRARSEELTEGIEGDKGISEETAVKE